MIPTRKLTESWDSVWPTLGETGLINAHVPTCFEVRFDGKMWQVLKDRQPVEHHLERRDAVHGVRRAMQRIFASGKPAQWRLIAVSA
ncbi:hypothetical protein [Asticcacaulis sp. AND118]|uniref:hypothetical protein n=1 Tax=Asticcacaulis sp. AND118 TaxID=2840468 RepID=UPI001CFF82CD|nr:hypothetical protein [Asticcacaulis sp. AND118]UDF05467.1 hypothetical protein LH365_14805 [Asticcacaulis sp. AND118]